MCPGRIPPPKLQQFAYIQDVVSDAIALGIVAFAISVSMAKILARKHDYEINADQVSSSHFWDHKILYAG